MSAGGTSLDRLSWALEQELGILSVAAERIADAAVEGTLPDAIDAKLYAEAKLRVAKARNALERARAAHADTTRP